MVVDTKCTDPARHAAAFVAALRIDAARLPGTIVSAEVTLIDVEVTVAVRPAGIALAAVRVSAYSRA